MIIEQFLTSVDDELSLWLLDKKPKTLKQVAKLSHEYIAVHNKNKIFNLTKTSFAAIYHEPDNNTYVRNDYQNNQGNFRGNFQGNATRSRGRGLNYKSNVECYNCKRTGHIT